MLLPPTHKGRVSKSVPQVHGFHMVGTIVEIGTRWSGDGRGLSLFYLKDNHRTQVVVFE
jgi:hypothetical protein